MKISIGNGSLDFNPKIVAASGLAASLVPFSLTAASYYIQRMPGAAEILPSIFAFYLLQASAMSWLFFLFRKSVPGKGIRNAIFFGFLVWLLIGLPRISSLISFQLPSMPFQDFVYLEIFRLADPIFMLVITVVQAAVIWAVGQRFNSDKD